MLAIAGIDVRPRSADGRVSWGWLPHRAGDLAIIQEITSKGQPSLWSRRPAFSGHLHRGYVLENGAVVLQAKGRTS